MSDDNKLMQAWLANTSNKYYFTISKCCGYKFFIPVYMNQTIGALYDSIRHETGALTFELYYSKADMQASKPIPLNRDIPVSTWISVHRAFFECSTSVPDPVIFNLWINYADGHTYDEHGQCTCYKIEHNPTYYI